MADSKLMSAYKTARDAFNGCKQPNDYRKLLRPLLHPDVVFHEVDDNQSDPIAGIDTVINYLEKSQDGYWTRFDDSTYGPREMPKTTDSSGVLHGAITGLGSYKDKDSDAKGKPVRYFFFFRRETANQGWLLIFAAAVQI